MQKETNIIDMSEFIEDNKIEKYKTLCYHGRTMIMMWNATGNNKYLSRAQTDLVRAKSIKKVGFIRPLGVLVA